MRGLLGKQNTTAPVQPPAAGAPVLDQPKLEREAGSIHDPVERLRFLRQEKVQAAAAASPALYLRREWQIGGAVLVLVVLALVRLWPTASAAAPVQAAAVERKPLIATPKSAVPESLPAEKIWLVETASGIETYANGLRIETRYATTNKPRSYVVYDRKNNYAASEPRNRVVGIVFHTTESRLVNFDPKDNAELRRHGKGTISYVQQVHAYHYVLDRFGRAYRVIREEDAAYHAGASIWADDDYAYLDLNHPFLGVSFETQSSTGDELPNVTAGQLTTARLLVDMLRQKYQIAARNCATHAQVSINASAMLVGYHTDWAGNFPFAEMGLPDNYEIPLPSQTLFGFGYDPVFLQATGSRIWKGLLTADDLIRERAKQAKVSAAVYKTRLQQEFRRVYPARAHSSAPEETSEGEQ